METISLFSLFHVPFLSSNGSVFIYSSVCEGHPWVLCCVSFGVCNDILNKDPFPKEFSI